MPSTMLQRYRPEVVPLCVGLALVLVGSGCAPGDEAGMESSGGSVAGEAVSAEIITGLVQGRGGPEAGVWVIAETDQLGTGFAKIAVTDDDGRFVLPELPDSGYDVWVRGYGLADSEPVAAAPGGGQHLSRQLLVLPHGGPTHRRLPGHRALRKRDQPCLAVSGSLDRRPEAGVPALPPTREPDHP